MHRTAFFASLSVLVTAAAAFAHGPVIQIGVAGNKIVTYGLVADTVNYTDATAPQSTYVVPMVQNTADGADNGWYAQPNPAHALLGPGIAYGGRGFDGGVEIRETVVDGLKLWNGTTFVDPGLEEIQGVNNVAVPTNINVSTKAGQANSFAITTPATVGATAHTQTYWRLLGDGVSPGAASDDGVYLLTLQLATSQPGIAVSNPFYLLLTKNASTAAVSAAQGYVNATLVPEPATLGLLGVGALALRRRRTS